MKRTLYLATLLWCWALLVQAQSQINGTVQVHPGGHMGVYNNLNFNTGYVITPRNLPGDNIYFTAGSTYTGVSDGSHVNGYAEEAGNASFTFPIGNGTTYRSASISSASSSVNYRAAYFSQDPNTATLPAGAPFPTTSRAVNLIDVSTKEYWDIDGSSAANITLSWNAASDLNNLTTGNANVLVIAGWDGTKWVNLGRAGGTTGLITSTGTITATNIVPDKYRAYTFAKLYCPLTATVSAASYTICAGATISLISSTTGVSPALLTYIWTGPNSYSASGSSVNIPNATVSASGAYTLVISDASGCSLTAVTPPITVKPTPVISSITVNQPLGCNNTDTGGFILNGLVPGTTYQVAFLQNASPFGPTPQTANASGQISFNGFSPGAYTNITATLDGCPSNVVSATLAYPTIPVPVLSVTPTSATICLGQSFTLSAVGASNGPNATFTFAGPGISSTTSNSAVVVTPSAGGNPIYTATQSASGCTSAPATISVTVNAPAVISSITPNNPTACATNTGSIQLNGLLPNTQYTVAYTRNAGTPTSTTYTSNASGQVVITSLLSGTYTTISASQGSCVAAASASTIVLADPNLPALTGYQIAGYSPTSCGSNTGRIDFTGLPANTGGIIINYTKNGVTTLANVSTDASGKATIFNLSAGNYANFTYQIGGCVSASSTVSVNLNDPGLVPLTSANISSLNPTSCGTSNGSITLSGLAANTSMTISYQRNGVNGTASVTTNGSGQAIIASLGAGAYTVITYTIGTCTAAPFSGTVAISDPGLTPLSGANVTGKAPSFCGGANGRIDITGLAGNQLVTINYKKDGVVQPPINAVSSASGQVTIGSLSQGVYNDITYTIGSCTSAPYLGSVNLLHPELTAPQFTAINPAICGSNTGRIEITGLSGNQSLAVNFTQNGTPVVVTVTTDPTGKAIITGLLSGTYTNFSYSVGACTSTVYSGPAYLSNPAPTVLNSTNVLGINPTQCGQVNGRIEITGLASNVSTTINYRRNGTAQVATVLSDAGGKAVIMGLSAGTYSDLTYTQGTCTSAPYAGPVNLLDPTPTPLTSSNVTPFNPTSCTATDGRIEFTGLASNIATVLSYTKDGIPASATVVSDASGKATLINLAPGNYANFSYSQGTCTSTPYSATLAVASVVCNRITMRLYLQGALFNNGGALSAANLPLMRDDLRAGNYIPLNDPYRTPAYASLFPQVNNTEFQTITPSMLTTTGDKAIVDWVFIELRDKTNPSIVKYTRSGLLLRDGTVMDTDGQSTLNFTNIPADNYYIAVRHRNHLGIMTAQTIAFPSSTVVDFINMTDVQVWNNTGYDGVERSTTTIGNATVRALWAGNAVHNNKVKYSGVGTDLPGILSDVLNYPNSGNAYNFSNAYGYLIGDVNMDGRALYIGAGNDGAFVLSNVLNYPLNSAKLYNYDLFYQQLP